jgi:hypothetical protein
MDKFSKKGNLLVLQRRMAKHDGKRNGTYTEVEDGLKVASKRFHLSLRAVPIPSFRCHTLAVPPAQARALVHC